MRRKRGHLEGTYCKVEANWWSIVQGKGAKEGVTGEIFCSGGRSC